MDNYRICPICKKAVKRENMKFIYGENGIQIVCWQCYEQLIKNHPMDNDDE